MSHRPKASEAKCDEKTVEKASLDGEKDALKAARSGGSSALQEVIGVAHELSSFCDESDLRGDYE